MGVVAGPLPAAVEVDVLVSGDAEGVDEEVVSDEADDRGSR